MVFAAVAKQGLFEGLDFNPLDLGTITLRPIDVPNGVHLERSAARCAGRLKNDLRGDVGRLPIDLEEFQFYMVDAAPGKTLRKPTCLVIETSDPAQSVRRPRTACSTPYDKCWITKDLVERTWLPRRCDEVIGDKRLLASRKMGIWLFQGVPEVR